MFIFWICLTLFATMCAHGVGSPDVGWFIFLFTLPILCVIAIICEGFGWSTRWFSTMDWPASGTPYKVSAISGYNSGLTWEEIQRRRKAEERFYEDRTPKRGPTRH